MTTTTAAAALIAEAQSIEADAKSGDWTNLIARLAAALEARDRQLRSLAESDTLTADEMRAFARAAWAAVVAPREGE